MKSDKSLIRHDRLSYYGLIVYGVAAEPMDALDGHSARAPRPQVIMLLWIKNEKSMWKL